MAKKQKKVKDNSIAGRIKGAMVKSSVACLAALGLMSLICISLATRAGEAGRGFAVVAEEIRKLAESSSQSALNTKTLIDASIKEVEVGNQITDVVQSNSVTAQESSAVCEELTAQAISLNDLVEEFSI